MQLPGPHLSLLGQDFASLKNSQGVITAFVFIALSISLFPLTFSLEKLLELAESIELSLVLTWFNCPENVQKELELIYTFCYKLAEINF